MVGSWKLVSVPATAPDGKKNDAPFGVNPTGELHYTAEGRVMFMLSYGALPQLSVADRETAPVAERAAARHRISTMPAAAATDGKVTHHIEMSSIQNWVQHRPGARHQGGGPPLTLTTPLPGSGGGASNELVWERIVRALATKPAAGGRTELRREDLSGAPGMEVVVSLATLAPGDEMPSHFHHGIETGYVLRGGMVEAPGRAPMHWSRQAHHEPARRGAWRVQGGTTMPWNCWSCTSWTRASRSTTPASPSMAPLRFILASLLALPLAAHAQQPLPVIDMHLHASSPEAFGGPQTVCTNRDAIEFPPIDRANRATVQQASVRAPHDVGAGHPPENAVQTGAMLQRLNIYGVLDVGRPRQASKPTWPGQEEWSREAPRRYWAAFDFSGDPPARGPTGEVDPAGAHQGAGGDQPSVPGREADRRTLRTLLRAGGAPRHSGRGPPGGRPARRCPRCTGQSLQSRRRPRRWTWSRC